MCAYDYRSEDKAALKFNLIRERVHSTYTAMGGGGVWPLRTKLYKRGGGVWPLCMYAFYRPNFLIFPARVSFYNLNPF